MLLEIEHRFGQGILAKLEKQAVAEHFKKEKK